MRACAHYCKFYWGVAFCVRFVAEMTNFIRPLCMQQVLLTLQLPPEGSPGSSRFAFFVCVFVTFAYFRSSFGWTERTQELLDELWFAPENVWMLAFAMFCSAMTWTFCNVHYNQWVMTHAMRLRSAVICWYCFSTF